MKLQEKLHRLREENGISQINLAEKLEVSRQTISRWEAGTSVPTTENLMRLSVLYGVPLDEWVKEIGHRPAVQNPWIPGRTGRPRKRLWQREQNQSAARGKNALC